MTLPTHHHMPFKNLMLLCGGFALMASFLVPSSAQAFSLGEKSSSFAVVNIQRLLSETEAAKDLSKQLTAALEAHKKENEIKEAQLLKEAEAIDARKDSITKEAYEQEKTVFKAKVNKLKELAKQHREDLDKRSAEALIKLRDQTLAIIKEISDREEYDAVFSQADVVLLKKEANITDEVFERVNAALPELKM